MQARFRFLNLDTHAHTYIHTDTHIYTHTDGLPCLQCRRPQFYSWVRKIPWRRDRLPTPVFLGFPGGSDSKESSCNVGDLDSIPGLKRVLWRGERPTHSSILAWRIPMDRGAWWATVYGSQRVWHNWATKHSIANIHIHTKIYTS